MTSCEEAELFLANCPGVKMDGGGDGVPFVVHRKVTEHPQRACVRFLVLTTGSST
jgi:hypothetical protein